MIVGKEFCLKNVWYYKMGSKEEVKEDTTKNQEVLDMDSKLTNYKKDTVLLTHAHTMWIWSLYCGFVTPE